MLQLVRRYYNGSSDLIREDAITMLRRTDTFVTGHSNPTWIREIRTTRYHIPLSRTVATIDVYGNYDDVEVYSGNFLWAQWDSPSVYLDMSDLPLVTETA